MTLARTLLVSAALAATAAPTSATTYVFTLSGGPTGSWKLPASPVPDVVFLIGFRLNSVSGTLRGAPFTDRMQFYEASEGGGVCIGVFCTLLDLYRPQLYSGTPAAPTFLRGSFGLNDPFGTPAARLTIAPIPEPASWAMLIAGFGLVGSALRRRAPVPA
ncbi:PEPxxWA-CTERM sorting domain-containing protein [Thermaurantiacus sp.]